MNLYSGASGQAENTRGVSRVARRAATPTGLTLEGDGTEIEDALVGGVITPLRAVRYQLAPGTLHCRPSSGAL